MSTSYNSVAGRTAVSVGWLLKFCERVPAHYTTSDIVTHIVGKSHHHTEWTMFCSLMTCR